MSGISLMEPHHLPEGWERAPLGEICSLLKRGIAPKYTEVGGIRVVNQKCIRHHRLDLSLARRSDLKKKRVPDERVIQMGDVLVNSTGTGTLGRVAQVRSSPEESTTVDTHVTIVRPEPGRFYPDFFGYALIVIEDVLIAGGRGAVGQTELPRTDIAENFCVTFPTSLDKQKRIVAVLDQAFAALDRARAHAEANLADAETLFKEILRNQVESDSQAFGTIELNSLSEHVTDGDHQPPPKAEEGVPFITISNIKKVLHEIDFTSTFFVSNEYFQNLSEKRRPRQGDILYTVTGSFGIPVLVRNYPDFCFQRHIALIRPNSSTDSRWLHFILMSPQCFEQAEAGATGTAQRTVSLKVLRTLTLPKTPLWEQTKSADRFETQWEKCSDVARRYRTTLADIADLRQSLLQKAFSGDLL